jgi:NTE family protein
MFGAAQIMQGAITAQKIKRRPPDILIRPRVEQFGLLDFFRAGQILRAAESSKEELQAAIKSQLMTLRTA